MDDKIIIGVFVYLALSTVVAAQLPAEYLSGSSTSIQSREYVVSGLNATELSNPQDEFDGSNSGIFKIARYLYGTWTIDGIPTILGALLAAFNFLTTALAIIWMYDKVRGIGS